MIKGAAGNSIRVSVDNNGKKIWGFRAELAFVKVQYLLSRFATRRILSIPLIRSESLHLFRQAPKLNQIIEWKSNIFA